MAVVAHTASDIVGVSKMSWENILKKNGLTPLEVEEIEGYERDLERAKKMADSRKYTSETRASIDAILGRLEKEIEILKKNGLDGSEVIFQETMDSLRYYINRQYPQTILEDEYAEFQ